MIDYTQADLPKKAGKEQQSHSFTLGLTLNSSKISVLALIKDMAVKNTAMGIGRLS